jgi:hypothetical protein
MVHRKSVFALAGILLAVALVVPPIILLERTNQDFNHYIVNRNNPGLESSGNFTSAVYQIQQNFQTTLIIVVLIEAVFAVLFAVTIWYGIKHIHPFH